MSEQGSIWSGRFQTSYAASIAALLVYVELISLGTPDSPFKTHYTKMMVSLGAACVYFAAALLPQMRNRIEESGYSPIFDLVFHIVATLSPVSLGSILVPERFSWLVFFVWAVIEFISAIAVARGFFSEQHVGTEAAQGGANSSGAEEV